MTKEKQSIYSKLVDYAGYAALISFLIFVSAYFISKTIGMFQ